MSIDMTTADFISKSEADTLAFAAGVAGQITPGTIIALHGDLGAGKTVFARGLAKGLGITEPVSSPTYTIIQEYQLASGWLFHLDLYRIRGAESALAFGVDEYLNEPAAIVLIEWPERITGLLPESTLHLSIEYLTEEERRLSWRRSDANAD
jgi:tRNA threonylcarbamoyladenosine biosynthesis protein TsaE